MIQNVNKNDANDLFNNFLIALLDAKNATIGNPLNDNNLNNQINLGTALQGMEQQVTLSIVNFFGIANPTNVNISAIEISFQNMNNAVAPINMNQIDFVGAIKAVVPTTASTTTMSVGTTALVTAIHNEATPLVYSFLLISLFVFLVY